MRNDELHRWINRELDGELSPEESERLEEALRRDPQARALRRDLVSMTQLVRSDRVGPAPVGLVSRIVAACEARPSAARASVAPPVAGGGLLLSLRRSAAVAAALLLLLGAFHVAGRPEEVRADDEQQVLVPALLMPEQDYLDILRGHPDPEQPASRIQELHDQDGGEG